MPDPFDPLAEAEELRDRIARRKRGAMIACAFAALVFAALVSRLAGRAPEPLPLAGAPVPPAAAPAESPAPPSAPSAPRPSPPAPAASRPDGAPAASALLAPAPSAPLPASDGAPPPPAVTPAADPLAAALALLPADPAGAAERVAALRLAATAEAILLSTLLRLEAGRYGECAALAPALPPGPERALVERAASRSAARIHRDRYGLSAECLLFRVEDAPVAAEAATIVALRALPGRRALSCTLAEGGALLLDPATGARKHDPALIAVAFSRKGNLLHRRAGFLGAESELAGTAGLAGLPALLAGRRAAPRAFALSPDGGLLALADAEGAFRVIDTASGLARFEALRRGAPAEGATPFAFAEPAHEREPRRLYFAFGREPGVLSVSALDLGRFEESRIASVRVSGFRAVGLDAARTHLLLSCVEAGDTRPSIRILGRFGNHPVRILDDAAHPAVDPERGGFFFARGGEIRHAALRPVPREEEERVLSALPAALALDMIEGAPGRAELRAALGRRRDEERAEILFHGARVLERLGAPAFARTRYETVVRDLPGTPAAALCRLALEKFTAAEAAR